MKVEIRQIGPAEEEKAVISVNAMTDNIRSAIDLLENQCRTIPVVSQGKTMMCRTDQIYYIESVDKKTFIYTERQTLMSEKRLYELEELLDKRDFFRCSKSVILHLNKVERLKPEITRNILATLVNGERVVVSRRYAPELKKLLGIGS